MEKSDLTEEKKQFIEDVGILFEEWGLPRMAGRILGWLMICIPDQQSASELGQVVGASKGSISTSMRMLTGTGLVERLGIPGERSAYFRLKKGSWLELMKIKAERLSRMRKLAERGLELMAADPPEHRARLEKMRDIYGLFENELPALLEKFEKMDKGGDQ